MIFACRAWMTFISKKLGGDERLGSNSDHSAKLPMRIMLWAVFCALHIVGHAQDFVSSQPRKIKKAYNMIVDINPFIVAEDSEFGSKIDGTSVDSQGRVYAMGFQGSTSQLGQLSNETGGMDQKRYFKWPDKRSFLNAIRFYPVPIGNSKVMSAAVVVDKMGQVLQVLEGNNGVVQGRVFCKHPGMIELSDVAVAYESGAVYSIGLNYTHGGKNFWLCNIPKDGAIHYSDVDHSGTITAATRLSVQGNATAIEVSNDEKHLLASETNLIDTYIHKSQVWKYKIDQETGKLSNKKLVFEEEVYGKARDVHCLRTDMQGNLYLARNGDPGEVVKVSPQGRVIKRMQPPEITVPSYIELGGPHGTTLFIVGPCKESKKKGCVDTWENSAAPGRAFFYLYRPVPKVPKSPKDLTHDEL